MQERHGGGSTNFEMKVIASYLHDPLARQCAEAIWIRNTDPQKRINNKEEYHQPGDIEISYAKNDNLTKNIDKKQKSQTDEQKQNDNTEIDDENEDCSQKRITEYFISKIRQEVENEQNNKVEDNTVSS